MFDIDALEAAGFTRVLTAEQWAVIADEEPLVNYRLVRGDVSLNTEQNTQDQVSGGLSTTVHYPEIAVLQSLTHFAHRVTCDASDTELILLLAEEIERTTQETTRRQRGNTNG